MTSTAESEVLITFAVPPASDRPQEFRRTLIQVIRESIAAAARAFRELRNIGAQ